MTVPAWRKSLDITPDPCTPGQERKNWASVIRMMSSIMEMLHMDGPSPIHLLTNNNSTAELGPITAIDGSLGFGGNFGFVFKNTEAFYCPWRAVLRVIRTSSEQDGDDITFAEHYHLIGRPNTTFQRRYAVNMTFDVEAGGYGIGAYLDTPAFVQVNGTEGAVSNNEEWGAKSGSWALWKDRPGFLMTGQGEGFLADQLFTGANLTVPAHDQIWIAPGQFKHVETVIAKTSGSVSVGAPDTLTVWSGPNIAGLVTTGQTISNAENWGPAITGVSFVTVSWPHGKPVFVKRCT